MCALAIALWRHIVCQTVEATRATRFPTPLPTSNHTRTWTRRCLRSVLSLWSAPTHFSLSPRFPPRSFPVSLLFVFVLRCVAAAPPPAVPPHPLSLRLRSSSFPFRKCTQAFFPHLFPLTLESICASRFSLPPTSGSLPAQPFFLCVCLVSDYLRLLAERCTRAPKTDAHPRTHRETARCRPRVRRRSAHLSCLSLFCEFSAPPFTLQLFT